MSETLLLGVDLGTQGLKVIVFDAATSAVIRSARRESDTGSRLP